MTNTFSLAILIPVYKQPKRLGSMLERLLADSYPHKRIHVAVDGAMEKSIAEVLEPFQGRVTVHHDGKHRGKAKTLNRVVDAIEADGLVFFDNDIELTGRSDFFLRVAEKLRHNDILELPKQAISTTLLSDLVALEFLDYSILAWIFTHTAGHCPAMNGAAFAVRREWFVKLGGFRQVIHEDIDFAARAFKAWARYNFDPQLQVGNEVPATLKEWFVQRKRWALNNLFWIKENLPGVILRAVSSPRLFFSFLIFLAPFLLIPLLFFILRFEHISFMLPVLFMLAQHAHGLAGIFLFLTHVHLLFEGGWLPMLLAFAVSLALHFGFARGLGYRFKIFPFLVYYFVYAPGWIVVNLAFWLYLVVRGRTHVDWEV
jgi:cellulose synthase/poly-beta-1,6-N-acetylglucosamine synthase-like glycosyltransferase